MEHALSSLIDVNMEEPLLKFLPLIFNKLLWLLSGDILVVDDAVQIFNFRRQAFRTLAQLLVRLDHLGQFSLVEAFVRRRVRIPDRAPADQPAKTRKRSEEEEQIETRHAAGAMFAARRKKSTGGGGGGGGRGLRRGLGEAHATARRGMAGSNVSPRLQRRSLKFKEFHEEVRGIWVLPKILSKFLRPRISNGYSHDKGVPMPVFSSSVQL